MSADNLNYSDIRLTCRSGRISLLEQATVQWRTNCRSLLG